MFGSMALCHAMAHTKCKLFFPADGFLLSVYHWGGPLCYVSCGEGPSWRFQGKGITNSRCNRFEQPQYYIHLRRCYNLFQMACKAHLRLHLLAAVLKLCYGVGWGRGTETSRLAGWLIANLCTDYIENISERRREVRP